MFHYLPLELRIVTYDYCELPSLKNLRLSCHKFQDEIDPILFHTVFLDLLPQSVETLRMIADNHIASHIQELVVSTNLLPDISPLTFERLLRCSNHSSLARFETQQILPSCMLRLQGKFRIWQRYRRYSYYVNQQRNLLLSQASLQRIIVKLVRLKKLKLQVLNNVEQSRCWFNFSRKVFGRDKDFDLCPIILSRSDTHLCAIHMLLKMCHNLTSLEIDQVSCSCWQFEFYTAVWRHLKRLRLCAQQGSTVEEADDVKTGLRKVLLELDLIEFLHLEITPTCAYLRRINIGEIFEDRKLTVLQHLCICTGKILFKDLLDMIQIHRRKLLMLSMTDVHLIDNSWEKTFQILKESLHNCVATFEGVTDGDGWTIREVVPFGQTLEVRQEDGRRSG